ncbi:MAG: glycosyltransferase, partial [Patescibacteria group bacterium]
KKIGKKSPNYVSFEYLGKELQHIYAITDLVIGRAGANSLYELAYLKKPNIVIPLSNADQMNNARYFEEKGASIIRKGTDRLFDLTRNLWQNKALQNAMKEALTEISGVDANEEIARLILD